MLGVKSIDSKIWHTYYNNVIIIRNIDKTSDNIAVGNFIVPTST